VSASNDLLDGISPDIALYMLQAAGIDAFIFLQNEDDTLLVRIVHAHTMVLNRTKESKPARKTEDAARRRPTQENGALQDGLQLVAECSLLSDERLDRRRESFESPKLPILHVVAVSKQWVVLSPVVHAV
jgi:hypothetical protein